MPRPEVMHHILTGKNLALISARSNKSPDPDHFFCSRVTVEAKCGESTTQSCTFPLYIYPFVDDAKSGQTGLKIDSSVWLAGEGGRRPNFCPVFIADLEKRLRLSFIADGKGDLKKTFGPEDVFDYIYAVFHSPTYRTRYAEFLKTDFPRVPVTSDVNLFRTLCAKGAELVALHLLESPKLVKPIARFPVKGSNRVDKGFPKYLAPGDSAGRDGTGKPLKEGRVYINTVAPVYDRRNSSGEHSSPLQYTSGAHRAPLQGQYFESVPPEVWNFHIGGYQVCEKWLKDRRGRTLTYEDLDHYCKVATAIKETIRLMAEMDAAIPKWPVE